MTYSPVEIRHVKLRRNGFGYRRAPVDRLLEDVADSFETVWRDRADLADEVERLEGELAHHKEHEQLLRTTLVSAERAATELKEQARREAETILAEARVEASVVTREARTERDLLVAEARRMRTLLHAALDALDEVSDAEAKEGAGPAVEAA
jgi:cell division initiation protein